MLKLYKANRSGNCWKVELLLRMIAIPYDIEFVDVLARKNRTASFQAISPFQQVPAIDEDGVIIWDSQAILLHLANGHARHWIPSAGSTQHAHMHQWLSIASNEIANSLQPMRLLHLIGRDEAAHHLGVAPALFDAEGCRRRCERLLNCMECWLVDHPWLAGDMLSVADIACFPYTWLAGDGRIDLELWPGVQNWLARIRKLPGYADMDSPSPLAARTSTDPAHRSS